jgi:glycosyltransferase involved in cell wall biosynthesis
MRITFLCPMPINTPVGGVKVMLEFASALAGRGHRVTIIAAYGNVPFDKEASLLNKLRRMIWFGLRLTGYKGGYKPKRWITLSPRVELLWRPSLDARWIPDGDAVISTAWESAEWSATYPETKGKKFYLIQNDESKFDNTDSRRAAATLKLPLKKLVTGTWMQTWLLEKGEASCWISQGVDYQDKRFALKMPIESRKPASVVMMYHTLVWKGSADGLAALEHVKARVPSLIVSLFGVPPAPEGLPSWIVYHRNPPQTELSALYNDAAIFISPSRLEGMSLPPTEAMQCGAALAVTDIGGHQDYAIHNQTALLSPPENPDALAANILRLIENPELRLTLARNAHEFIQQFTWERATTKLEQCLTS